MTAVRQFIASQDGQPFPQIAVKMAVNTSLNSGYDPYDKSTEIQVIRALEKLAAAGTLVKVGRGETGPSGRRNVTRQPDYYTPDAYTAAEAAALDKAARSVAMTARRAQVHDELARRGIFPVTERGASVRLSTADWFRLLGLDGD